MAFPSLASSEYTASLNGLVFAPTSIHLFCADNVYPRGKCRCRLGQYSIVCLINIVAVRCAVNMISCVHNEAPQERSCGACGNAPGNVLLSQGPAAQVPSALEDFTSVFGMVTGVSPPLSSPDPRSLKTEKPPQLEKASTDSYPSASRLAALPRRTDPPRLLQGVLPPCGVGNLILRRASRLDAFSASPSPTWLPSGAPGGTTGTPAVGPSRSSRTKDSPSQVSSARGR